MAALGACVLSAQGSGDITSSTLSALKFRGIGPAMCSGRIVDIAVDPVVSSRWFIAAASGGVWRTENNGTTFEPVFDEEGSYILNKSTGEVNWLRAENGNYLLDVWIPPAAAVKSDPGFGRQP